MCLCNYIPAHYFKLIDILGDVSTCPNPSPVVERDANIHPGKVVERYKNMSAGIALEVRFARQIATDRFLQVKTHVAEPTATPEGNVCTGASTAA